MGMTNFIINSITNIKCSYCNCDFEEGYDVEYDSTNGNFYCNYECLENYDNKQEEQ